MQPQLYGIDAERLNPERKHGQRMKWRSARNVVLYAWASPNSCLGALFGALSLCSGGDVLVKAGVVGFTGKLIGLLFEILPNRPVAMTLGHVILARNRDCFLMTLSHELVHVRQYERWGPFFIPAYLCCSLGIQFSGGDPYRDNPFEREAFEKVPNPGIDETDSNGN